MLTINVPRRGGVEIEYEVANRLLNSEEFEALLEAKIVTLKPLSSARYVLSAGAYVGHVQIGKTALVIGCDSRTEFESLKSYAFGRAKQLEKLNYVTEDANPIADILSRFVSLLSRYVSTGRTPEYVRVTQQSAFLSGQLDVKGTLAMRCSGQSFRFSSNRFELTRDTPRHRVIGEALRSVTSYGADCGLDSGTLVRARTLAGLFPQASVQRTVISLIDQTPLLLGARTETGEVRDLIMLALAIADGRYTGLSGSGLIAGVRGAVFVDLSRLFEIAVRKVLAEQLSRDTQVTSGKQRSKYLFTNISDYYHLDPDIVVGNFIISSIGDVKYKEFSGRPSHDDIYQLITHANGLAVQYAFLIYPGTFASEVYIGTTSSQLEVRAFTVRVDHLDCDLQEVRRWIVSSTPHIASHKCAGVGGK